MNKTADKAMKEKKVKAVPVWMGILVFILAFGAGIVSKSAIGPSWAKEYSVPWSDALGTRLTDLRASPPATKAGMWKCFPGSAKKAAWRPESTIPCLRSWTVPRTAQAY